MLHRMAGVAAAKLCMDLSAETTLEHKQGVFEWIERAVAFLLEAVALNHGPVVATGVVVEERDLVAGDGDPVLPTPPMLSVPTLSYKWFVGVTAVTQEFVLDNQALLPEDVVEYVTQCWTSDVPEGMQASSVRYGPTAIKLTNMIWLAPGGGGGGDRPT
jgi:hypothetical protein